MATTPLNEGSAWADWPARLRLISGLILMFYAFTHLLNHAMGIVGLDVMENGRDIFLAFWRSLVLMWLVPLSILVHVFFVCYKFTGKKTFKGMRNSEWIQLAFGVAIPLFLLPHVYVTRIAILTYQVEDSYTFFLATWYPHEIITMLGLILVIWTHGVIGLYLFLAQKPWFGRSRRLFDILSVVIPLLAIWGVVSAGREVNLLKQDPTWMDDLSSASNPLGIDWTTQVLTFSSQVVKYFLISLIVLVLLRSILNWYRKRNRILVSYLQGSKVSIPRGTTLLEASLIANIPHAHVCGGRGRCSTCRVEVIDGLETLPTPSADESNLLKRVRVGRNVRLACQTRPTDQCTIYPLLLPNSSGYDSSQPQDRQGADKEIAILFSDLRGFTSMSEGRLPYDVVFILNQYFQFMGHAIESHGGKVDKFIGDGIMALFGLENGAAEGCRDALKAAREMSFQLDRLNIHLQNEIEKPLRIGIGIHTGQVIVGEMGYKKSTNLTAIGDATNTASRLESACKELDSELVISDEVMQRAQVRFTEFERHTIQLRGKSESMDVHSFKLAKQLPADLEQMIERKI